MRPKITSNFLLLSFFEGVIRDPSLTFWAYLSVRTGLGVLTAASLMMFEGAVMATIQEMGGDYGIQRFGCSLYVYSVYIMLGRLGVFVGYRNLNIA